VDVPGYGDTRNFTVIPPVDPMTFVASSKEADRFPGALLLFAAKDGFDLGVHFRGLPYDENVHLPPLNNNSTGPKLAQCMKELNPELQSNRN
jgi:hypothetical protein